MSVIWPLSGAKQPLVDCRPRSSYGTELSPPTASPPERQGSAREALGRVARPGPESRCTAFPGGLSKVQLVDQRMRLECGVGFRQPRTRRRTRPGQLCANSGREQTQQMASYSIYLVGARHDGAGHWEDVYRR